MIKKQKIVGIECLLINNQYCIPRNKCDNVKLLKIMKQLKYYKKIPACIVYNNRYYYSIYNLFSEYAKIIYLTHKKKYKTNIINFVRNCSIKNKTKTWEKKTYDILKQNSFLFSNYNSYVSQNYNLLTNEGEISMNAEPLVEELSNVCILYANYKKYKDFFIIENVYEKYYNFKIMRSAFENTDSVKANYEKYERYDFSVDNKKMITIDNINYVNQKKIFLNNIISNICLNCQNNIIVGTYCDINKVYKPCECSSCENWNGCGKEGYNIIVGIAKGKLFLCLNCDKYIFVDIETSEELKNIDVKYELVSQVISKIQSLENIKPKIRQLLFAYEKKYKMQKINKDYINIDICLKCINKEYENTKIKCIDLNRTLNDILINKMRMIKIKKIRELFDILENNLVLKKKITQLKFTYGNKYKDSYIVDIINDDFNYIQWIISHNLELDTYREENDYGYTKGLKIKKTKKQESKVTSIVRYKYNLPKYPCDQNKCKKYAMYGIEKNLPFRCALHKAKDHNIVIKTACRGIDDVCPYDCKSGVIVFDNYCTYCFMNLFPADPRTANIRKKTKELEVVNHICNFHNGEWYHDQPLWIDFEGGCCVSKRRIDLRQMIQSTLLCIEIDENQHKYYTNADDFIRYNELMCDLTCKYIFIRYNPDSYKIGINKVNTATKERLEILDKEIKKQIVRINNDDNNEFLEIIHLFYDTNTNIETKKECNKKIKLSSEKNIRKIKKIAM